MGGSHSYVYYCLQNSLCVQFWVHVEETTHAQQHTNMHNNTQTCTSSTYSTCVSTYNTCTGITLYKQYIQYMHVSIILSIVQYLCKYIIYYTVNIIQFIQYTFIVYLQYMLTLCLVETCVCIHNSGTSSLGAWNCIEYVGIILGL